MRTFFAGRPWFVRLVAVLVSVVLLSGVVAAFAHTDGKDHLRSVGKGEARRPASTSTTVPTSTSTPTADPGTTDASEPPAAEPAADGQADDATDPPPPPATPWIAPESPPEAPPSDHVTVTRPCPELGREAPALVDQPGLYLVRTDGSVMRFLADNSVGSISPDGRMIVFSTGNGGLCVADVAAGPARRLADQYVSALPTRAGIVEWAPDAHAVVAPLRFSAGERYVVLPINGPPGLPIDPPGSPTTWSPDSARLCTATAQSLIVMNPDGSNRQTIYTSSGDGSGYGVLQWLSGSIYTTSGFGTLTVVAADGSSATPLTGTATDSDVTSDGWAALTYHSTLSVRSPSGEVAELSAHDYNARWMSDGRIVYWTRLAVTDEVRVVSRDGSNVQTLLVAPGGSSNLHVAQSSPARNADLVAVTIAFQAQPPRSG